MSINSEISKSVLLDMYSSRYFSDLEKYISAMYYGEAWEFIWNVPQEPQYKLFITGGEASVASSVFEDLICRIEPEYLYTYDEYLDEGKDDTGAIVLVEVDCNEPNVVDRLKHIASELHGICALVSVYNLQGATNDTLLWLTDWLRQRDTNFVVALEANQSGTHSLILNLEEVFDE